MIPQVLLDELFNLSSINNDIIIDHICNIIEDYGYNITLINNHDLAITIIFNNINDKCELRIDRLACRFELSAKHYGHTYIPMTGDWELILQCLNELSIGEPCIK